MQVHYREKKIVWDNKFYLGLHEFSEYFKPNFLNSVTLGVRIGNLESYKKKRTSQRIREEKWTMKSESQESRHAAGLVVELRCCRERGRVA